MSEADPVRAFLQSRRSPDFILAGGLEGLVRAWTLVAARVAAGYDGTLEEYLNDVDLRNLLDGALAAAGAGAGDAPARAAEADGAFRSATRESACVWGEANAAEQGWSADRQWWYFRLPLRPGELLSEDIARDGLA